MRNDRYWDGFLGVLVGLFAAWSATPIVNTLLPLLFGIVGGVSGVSVAKMDVSSAKGQVKIQLLGQMLAAFSIACIVAVVVAVYFRPRVQQLDQVSMIYGKSSTDYVDGLVLRRKLMALGASPTEVGYVLELLNAEVKPDLSAINAKLDEVVLGIKVSATESSRADPSSSSATPSSRSASPPSPAATGADPTKKEEEPFKQMTDPSQWIPTKPWFPLAAQPPNSSFGYTFDGNRFLYGYGGAGSDSLNIKPDSPLLDQFRKPADG